MTWLLKLYGWAMRRFHSFVPMILERRVVKGKEDPARVSERLGQTQVPRQDGELVWFHGVSVGESLSALPLINQLLINKPHIQILITTGTTTSAQILKSRLPNGVIHQFAPVDTPQAVEAFLDHWRPQLAVFIESDLWPNLLMALDARGVTRLLLSARITEKTARGWGRIKSSMRHILSGFALILPQDLDSEKRLSQMGKNVAARLGPVANLKTLGEALPDASPMRSALKKQIGQRPIILAASTHPTEEAYIAHALSGVLRQTRALLIIVPRHPNRAEEIRLDMVAIGFRVAQRSTVDSIEPDTHIYLADTLGELGLFFRLADVVIMGGSFSEKIGGHNPLEAARVGRAVITGPDLFNWAAVYDTLLEAGAALKVRSGEELSLAVQTYLASPDALKQNHRRALTFATTAADTLPSVWAQLTPYLPDQESPHAA